MIGHHRHRFHHRGVCGLARVLRRGRRTVRWAGIQPRSGCGEDGVVVPSSLRMVDSVLLHQYWPQHQPNQCGRCWEPVAFYWVAAVAGKLIGAGLPAFLQSGRGAAALIGVSMVPRAEIALVVVQTGSNLGDWAVPGTLYGAIVFVSAATCITAPIVLRSLFKKHGPDGK